MLAKKKLEKALENITVTDEAVTWVKNKVATVEGWKDIAVSKLTEIEGRIAILETKAAALPARLTNIESRLTAIEKKISI